MSTKTFVQSESDKTQWTNKKKTSVFSTALFKLNNYKQLVGIVDVFNNLVVDATKVAKIQS